MPNESHPRGVKILSRTEVLMTSTMFLQSFLDLNSLSHRTQLHFSWRPNLLDETDNKFIEAAIAATAIIVTYNVRDFALTDLVKHE